MLNEIICRVKVKKTICREVFPIVSVFGDHSFTKQIMAQ